MTETLIATLKVADPDAVIANSFADFFIGFIADSTGETPAQVRARLSTPATPTPTPTPTGSATATPSPTPTPTGSPTATPSPTPTPVSTGAMLDIWDVADWHATIADTTRNMVITWDETTLVHRSPLATRTPTTEENTRINNVTDNDAKIAGYLTRAEIRFDTGNYSDAIADLTSAIDLETTTNYEYVNLRGIAHAFNKDYANAITDFTSVLENVKVEATRGAAHNNRAVVKALQANYVGALNDYTTAVGHLTNDSAGEKLAYNNKGNTLRARGNPDSTPNDGTANSDLDLAIAAYGSAIGNSSSDNVNEARFENNRGLAYMERGETDSGRNCDATNGNDSDLDCAIADFANAIGVTTTPNPEMARFHNNRGLAYRADKTGSLYDCDSGGSDDDSNLDCAIADFNTAYAKAGTDADKIEFLNNRGLAHVARDNNNNTDNCGDGNSNESDLDCAIDYYSIAINTLRSNDPDIYNNRGLAYKARKNPAGPSNDPQSDIDLAISDFTNAIRLRRDGDFYNNRGLAYVDRGKSGDTSLAISDFTEAIKRNPADSVLYTQRGTAYSANSQNAKASQDLLFANKINNSNVRCSDFQGFDTAYGTSFGSDRAAANAFFQAAMKEGYSQSDLNALMTGGAVCPSL